MPEDVDDLIQFDECKMLQTETRAELASEPTKI